MHLYEFLIYFFRARMSSYVSLIFLPRFWQVIICFTIHTLTKNKSETGRWALEIKKNCGFDMYEVLGVGDFKMIVSLQLAIISRHI